MGRAGRPRGAVPRQDVASGGPSATTPCARCVLCVDVRDFTCLEHPYTLQLLCKDADAPGRGCAPPGAGDPEQTDAHQLRQACPSPCLHRAAVLCRPEVRMLPRQFCCALALRACMPAACMPCGNRGDVMSPEPGVLPPSPRRSIQMLPIHINALARSPARSLGPAKSISSGFSIHCPERMLSRGSGKRCR